jgi:hypothetical protein
VAFPFDGQIGMPPERNPIERFFETGALPPRRHPPRQIHGGLARYGPAYLNASGVALMNEAATEE